MSMTATSATGSGIAWVPATGEPPPTLTRLPIVMPFESSAERLMMPVTSTKWPSSFLTSFMMSPLPASRNDLPRTIGPLWVSVSRAVGHRQNAPLQASRDHQLDRVVRDTRPLLTGLLIARRSPARAQALAFS